MRLHSHVTVTTMFKMMALGTITFLSMGLSGCPGSAPGGGARVDPNHPPRNSDRAISLSHGKRPPMSLELPDQPEVQGPAASGAALDHFFGKLHALRKDPAGAQSVSILHVGDSHIASDTLTGQTRRLFQRGWKDGGRGYTFGGKPWRNYRQEGVTYDMGGSWVAHQGRLRDAQGLFGFGGVRMTSSEAGDWITREDSGSEPIGRLRVFTLGGDGTGSFKVYADASADPVGTYSTSHSPDPQDASAPTQVVQTHDIEFDKPVKTIKIESVDDAPVSIMGVYTARATPGIVYNSVGLNGARAKTMLGFDEDLSVQELAGLGSDLFVLAFGTNEAYNLRKTDLEPKHRADIVATLTALIERYKKATPQASCVVMLPMEFAIKPTAKTCYKRKRVRRRRRWRWTKKLIQDIDLEKHPECAWTTPPSLAMVREATQEVAAAKQCATWDLYEAMGGQGSMRAWRALETPFSGSDGVHLRLSGYRYLGQMFYTDLMAAYERWSTGADATLTTTPWPVADETQKP